MQSPWPKRKSRNLNKTSHTSKITARCFLTMCWGSAQPSCGFAGRENTNCTVPSSWQPCLHSPVYDWTNPFPCTRRTTCGIFQMPTSSIGANWTAFIIHMQSRFSRWKIPCQHIQILPDCSSSQNRYSRQPSSGAKTGIGSVVSCIVWEWYRYSARAILVRLRRSVQ